MLWREHMPSWHGHNCLGIYHLNRHLNVIDGFVTHHLFIVQGVTQFGTIAWLLVATWHTRLSEEASYAVSLGQALRQEGITEVE